MSQLTRKMAKLKCLGLLITLIIIAKCSNILHFLPSLPTPVVHLEDLWSVQTKEAIPSSQRYSVQVDVSESIHITLPHYLSINIDANQIKNRLRGLDFR
ncbi:hypothetical protein ElyMa_006855800 [Elysia marginata]|uniref:Uncharacterized protein n=1 Tax=Elysia marginata TaxID=1093978 RepID=A0AAV4JB97_9GAST|nr:hypothetical protein ElyMa_006855800 [Elysia marginata]